jgi:hypothetical protein
MSLVKATADGVGMDDLPERIATTIELALEIEAADADTEHHAAAIGAGSLRSDLNVTSRDGWSNPKKISDSLAPPPLQSGSLILAEDNHAPVIPIRPGPPATHAATAPAMSQAELAEAVRCMQADVVANAPSELQVMPEGGSQPITLLRHIESIPESGMVKLSYRLGYENMPSPSIGGSTSAPAQVTPMAVDVPASVSFSVESGHNQATAAQREIIMRDKISQITKLAAWLYRVNKTPVVSATIPRAGNLSFDRRMASGDEA